MPEEEYLYHYTNGHALLSIISTGQLWATQTSYLNDANEGKGARDRLIQELKRSKMKLIREASERVLAAFEHHLRRGRQTFVCSFSRKNDMLTQHRMYCPPTGGYVIGFPRSYLAKAGDVVDVNYSEEEQRRWALNHVAKFIATAESVDDGKMKPAALCEKVNEFGLHEDKVSRGSFFKSAEFLAEDEVRLVERTIGPPLFRASPSGTLLVPYRVIDLPEERVVVRLAASPGFFNDLATQGLFNLTYNFKPAKKWFLSCEPLAPSGYRNLGATI